MEENHEGAPGAAGNDVAEIMGLMQSTIDDTRQLLEALMALKATHANMQNMAGHVMKLGERMSHYDVATRDDGRTLAFDDPWSNLVEVRAGTHPVVE